VPAPAAPPPLWFSAPLTPSGKKPPLVTEEHASGQSLSALGRRLGRSYHRMRWRTERHHSAMDGKEPGELSPMDRIYNGEAGDCQPRTRDLRPPRRTPMRIHRQTSVTLFATVPVCAAAAAPYCDFGAQCMSW